jgi:dephospho-CoA kinase
MSISTAIVGLAGSGKSTIFKKLQNEEDCFINVDQWIIDSYENNIRVKEYISTYISNEIIVNGKVDKEKLIVCLYDETTNQRFGDFLFNYLFLPEILSGINIVIDGILPRYMDYFDQVIYIEMSYDSRIENLLSRGLSRDKIEQIAFLQNKLFFNLRILD